ncbi:MAG: 6-phosphogluconolactonase [bacterium]|nr:6-phosphogluconolactonase [bacterium]
MEVKRYSTKEEVQEKAGAHLNKVLDAHAHVPTLFLSSGGSSLELLERISIFPSNLTIGMTDERFSENPKVNNFAQLTETSFFQKAEERGAYFIDTRVQPGDDIEIFAKRFHGALAGWREEHSGGRIVITQGVGPDGHTVGIMPHPKEQGMFAELFAGEHLAVGYDAGDKNEYPLRATITLPFLRMVDHSLVYMVGDEKKNALEKMLGKDGTLYETPARIIREMPEVHIFTDIKK